ncbi:MAG: alpha-glucan family phosphorylase [Acidobacteria bacterium]|nr:alpha-glucan family phosphorylase [Acidobacteriota bacterium]
MQPHETRNLLPEIRTLAITDFYIPDEFARLRELTYNLWWSWVPEPRMLFSSIQPELWLRYRSPVEVLLQLEPHQWETLAQSNAFQSSFDSVMGMFDRYMKHPEKWWFYQTYPDYQGGPIVYLSTEFGLHECLGIYSGGLGVLSGDHCKAASDLGLPFIAVGLLYRRGYFRQTIDAEGRQQHFYPDFDTKHLPAMPVLGPYGRPLVVSVPLLDRKVHLAVYKAQVGRIPVLLLDSDLPQNEPQDRPITHILYVRGREMRLCQEMVLGVGAVKAIRALGLAPAVWHLNEGHVALMLLELLREEIQRGERFHRAVENVSRSVVFTTHTPVPAGNESFDADLARLYLGNWAGQIGIPVSELMALGRVHVDNESDPFNLTALSLRVSAFRNGVSRKHGEVSRQMWRELYPDREPPITSVTNGVHVETWLGLELRDLMTRRMGPDWRKNIENPAFWEDLDRKVPDDELWMAHQAQKRRLIRTGRDILRRMFARHGASPRDLAAVNELLDPKALTIGFARRFALYKRAWLLFRDLARLRKILCNPDHPVQIIFAGKAHPADLAGQDLISQIFRLAQSADFRGKVVFLEDYDLYIGRLLVQGVDVWLNNPRRPLEASGTSGQKAAVNGALNLSVLDGWWIEGYAPDVGWAIGRPETLPDEDRQDSEDAHSLYDLLEHQVIPLFFDRDSAGLPHTWLSRMKASIRTLLPVFSSARMVREYTTEAYMPLALDTKPPGTS